MPKILPVIHHINLGLTLDQADLAFEAGADGVFLISHNNADEELYEPLILIKNAYPDKFIGVNFLNSPVHQVYPVIAELGIDGLWSDNIGITSAGVSEATRLLKSVYLESTRQCLIFGSIAFKYQRHEPDPTLAAKTVERLMVDTGRPLWIPTTSGAGTGEAPTAIKIATMSKATNGNLAIASGMTPENVAEFVPFVSHILVATGISQDAHHFDYEKLVAFIGAARSIK